MGVRLRLHGSRQNLTSVTKGQAICQVISDKGDKVAPVLQRSALLGFRIRHAYLLLAMARYTVPMNAPIATSQ